MPSFDTRAAGIVLAGGNSSRMGSAKASLDWRGTPMVVHAARLLDEAGLSPVVVVHAPGQLLPRLADDVRLVADAQAGLGPLEGLRAGLVGARGSADRAFVTATDLPLLTPAFVAALGALMRPDDDAVVVSAHGRLHPLAAWYRTRVADAAARLLDSGERRLTALLEMVCVRVVEAPLLRADERLRADDPELRSLTNLNDADAYRAALALG